MITTVYQNDKKPQNKEDAMIKFWLNVTEDPATNMEKRLEMGVLVDGVKKQSMTVVPMYIVSKYVVKYRIRTEMMKLFLEELDSYLDNAFGQEVR